ncbi:glycosyltransferase [Paraburkholderia agricolaris]|uniref:glycosyltransferase n=1 Tax=Paraburkholderia agricolaris TaxID=2152888 RepID=UPI00142EED6D|nr:glycosyltransferase [Paraburkholderia agricolaris]
MSIIRQVVVVIALSLSALFLGIQFWTTSVIAVRSEQILREYDARPPLTSMAEEKARQEAIAAKIQNVKQGLFWTGIAGNLSAAAAVIVALSGAWIGFHQYLGVRQKERVDRASAELKSIWEMLADKSAMVRGAGMAALQNFLGRELSIYHSSIASALSVGCRSILAYSDTPKDSEFLLRTVTPVIERAFRSIDHETLGSVSWQGVVLYYPRLNDLDLHGFDFRDAIIMGGDFTGSNLQGCRFNAARLTQCQFDGADLRKAVLEHADLASASFKGANLSDTDLRNVKILHTDFSACDLRDARFSRTKIDWTLTKGWRTSHLDPGLRKTLIAKHGPEATGPRALMMCWEFPPFVSGGGWTAAYHLVRRLRRKGSDLTLLAPWPHSSLSPYPFGHEVEVAGVGIDHAGIDMRPFQGFSAYGSYGAYSSAPASEIASGLVQAEGEAGSIVDEVSAFARRCADFAEESGHNWKIIHAHDWVTFPAAARLARVSSSPWIAHFHSTEWDRRGDKASELIHQIEEDACRAADKILVPSTVLRDTLVRVLKAERTKILVVPNCFEFEPEELQRRGSFKARRVIFAGRITAQKGPDYFIEAATRIRKRLPEATFAMYGEGDMVQQIATSIRQYFHPTKFIPPVENKQGTPVELIVSLTSVIVATRNPVTGRLSYKNTSSPASLDRELEARIAKGGFTLTLKFTPDGYHLVTFGEGARQENFLVYGPGLWREGDPIVEMNGFVDWSARNRMFRNASAVIVPSRSEPFGMIILEAMENGVPVFYSRNAGVSDVLQTDLTIDPEDAEAVAGKVCELLSNERRWLAVVEEQRAALLKFSKTPCEDEVVRTWKSLIQRT